MSKKRPAPRRAPAAAHPAQLARWPTWLCGVLVAVLAGMPFLGTLGHDFVSWDDELNFTTNYDYRGLGLEQVKWMFTTNHGGHYQPLSWLTLGLDYVLWGMRPGGYHLTNILWHAAAAAAFYCLTLVLWRRAGLVRGSAGPPVCAALAALLFAAHPLRAESVAWITERRDVVSGLLFMLTLLAYLRYAGAEQRKAWLVLAVLLQVCTVLAKLVGVTLLAVIVVLDVYPLRRLGGPAGWRTPGARRVWLEKLPFLVVTLIGCSYAPLAQGYAMMPLSEYGVAPRLAQAAYGLVFYVWKTLLPVGLSPLYEVPATFDPFGRRYVLYAALVILATLGLLWARRRWPAGLAVWVCYVAVVSPVLGIAQSGPQLVADRYSYLSCCGFAVLLGAGLLKLWNASRHGAAAVLTAALAVVVGLGMLAARQAAHWRDSPSLWRRVVRIEPQSFRGNRFLGRTLADDGDAQGALNAYRRAAEARTMTPGLMVDVANALARLDRPAEAIELYREAAALEPDLASAHYNLANTLAEQGMVTEARQAYEAALRVNPDYALAHFAYAMLLAGQRETDAAIDHLRQAVRCDPGYARAYNNLGVLLGRQGLHDLALRHFRRAVELQPDYAEARGNLNRALARKARTP